MFRLKKPKHKFAKKSSKKEIQIPTVENEETNNCDDTDLELKYKDYLEKLPEEEHTLFGDENWTISDQVRDTQTYQ